MPRWSIPRSTRGRMRHLPRLAPAAPATADLVESTISTAPLRVGLDVSPLALTRARHGSLHQWSARRSAGHRRGRAAPLSFRLRTSRDGRDSRPRLVPVALPRAARRSGVDVLHCPTFRAPLTGRHPRRHLPRPGRAPNAALLQPMEPRLRSGTCSSTSRGRARPIIAVSEFTRREVIELLGVREERIHVVPNGVGAPFTREGRGGFGRVCPRRLHARAAQEPGPPRPARSSSPASPAASCASWEPPGGAE